MPAPKLAGLIGGPTSERGKQILQEFPALDVLRRHDRKGVNGMLKVVDDCTEYNRRYAEPMALEIDRRIGEDHDYFNWDIVKAGCRYRFLSMAIPEGVGGTAGKYIVTNLALAVHELCSTCGGISLIFGAHALGISPLVTAGAMAHWDTVLYSCTR